MGLGRAAVGSPLRQTAGRIHGINSKSFQEWAYHQQQIGAAVASPHPAGRKTAAEVIANSIEGSGRTAGVTTFGGHGPGKKAWTGYRTISHTRGDYEIIKPAHVGATSILNSGADSHFIGAKMSPEARAIRAGAIKAAGNVGLFSNVGGAKRLRRVSGRGGGARRLVWEGQRYPVPYVRHPGAGGMHFVKPGFEAGRKIALEVYSAAMFIDILSRLK